MPKPIQHSRIKYYDLRCGEASVAYTSDHFADADCESLRWELPINRHFAQPLLAAEIGSDGDRTLLGLRWACGGGCKDRERDAKSFEGDGGKN